MAVESGGIRREAARALGELGDKRAVEPLIGALADHGITAVTLRRESAVALGKLGDRRAIEPLAAALRDESEDVQRAAAKALERIGGPRAEQPLRKHRASGERLCAPDSTRSADRGTRFNATEHSQVAGAAREEIALAVASR